VEDPSASKTSAALTTSTADLPKTLPAAEDSATGNAHTAVNGATSPDATEDEGKTTTTASPQSADKPVDPTDKLTDATDPTKDGTAPGAHSTDDTTTTDAGSVKSKGTGQVTSKSDTEGAQDVSTTTHTKTYGGRHRADDTASNTTNTDAGGRRRADDTASNPNAGGRHHADDTASGSNAGTSSASSSEAGSNKK
jgi:hypothetical protein